ncbi:MAG TPA: hypothetical protein VIH85_15970 [Solirubrobacteraceae bacterium]
MVLTVPRASPVAFATSPAVRARSLESAASTFALVSPRAVRVDLFAPFAVLAVRTRVRAAVGCGASGVFAGGCDLAVLDLGVERSRGSSAASA